jgi:heme-degrading monooxygenase HmoA
MEVSVTDAVTLINVFAVDPPGADSFIVAWERTRDALSIQPGYIDTALHQAIAPGARFQFINVAR